MTLHHWQHINTPSCWFLSYIVFSAFSNSVSLWFTLFSSNAFAIAFCFFSISIPLCVRVLSRDRWPLTRTGLNHASNNLSFLWFSQREIPPAVTWHVCGHTGCCCFSWSNKVNKCRAGHTGFQHWQPGGRLELCYTNPKCPSHHFFSQMRTLANAQKPMVSSTGFWLTVQFWSHECEIMANAPKVTLFAWVGWGAVGVNYYCKEGQAPWLFCCTYCILRIYTFTQSSWSYPF